MLKYLIYASLNLLEWLIINITVDLEMDQITHIEWNKIAFDHLVIEEDTKELVKAIIMNQIVTEKSTDLISGKGNGVIILLHGYGVVSYYRFMLLTWNLLILCLEDPGRARLSPQVCSLAGYIEKILTP